MTERPLDRSAFRFLFLSTLNDEELESIFSKSANEARNSVSTDNMLKVLGMAGFPVSADAVEKAIRTLKTGISEPDQMPEKFPDFPEGLKITSKILGCDISVTKHAWERFCERYIRSVPVRRGWDYSQEFFSEHLRRFFAEATEEDLGQPGVVRRLINNRFESALYFLNKEVGLRFIISPDKTLLTVEMPTQYLR